MGEALQPSHEIAIIENIVVAERSPFRIPSRTACVLVNHTDSTTAFHIDYRSLESAYRRNIFLHSASVRPQGRRDEGAGGRRLAASLGRARIEEPSLSARPP